MGVLSRRLSKDERNSYRDEQRLLLPGGRYVLQISIYFALEETR